MKGRTSKRLLSALLSLVMLLSLLPVAAFATEPAAPKTATWTKVALSDIAATDTVAITMTKDKDTWVLPTTGEGSQKQPLAVTATVADGKLTTSGSAEKYGWTITAVEGGYHIKTGSKFLYLTAANNGMRIGGTEMVWSLSDDGYLTAKDSSDTSRYLGVYNSTDWRCYNNTTGNIAGQTLAFYKLDAGGGTTETVEAPTASPAPGRVEKGTKVTFTAADGLTIKYHTGDGVWNVYDGNPIELNSNTAFTVKAVNAISVDSKVVTFNYTVYHLVDKYVKTTTLATGDQVVIYNAGNGYAVKAEMLGSYYLTPMAATVADDVLTADSMDKLVWTVTKNEDGTYTFKQGDKTLTMGTNDGKFNLNLTGNGAAKWDVETCNAENASYYMSGNGLTGQYGKVYMEYYAKFTEFSAYCTSTDRLTEKDFGMTFYKLTKVEVEDGETPADTVATPTASIPNGEEVEKGATVEFKCATDGATIQYKTAGDAAWTDYKPPLAIDKDVTFTVRAIMDGMKDSAVATFAYTVKKAEAPLFQNGDKVVIYNPANMKALSTEYTSFYNKGTDVTLTNGKLTGYTDADVWTVGVNADGTYTFSTADGKKLSMGTGYASTPLNDVNTAWKISAAATTGCYYIQNAVRGNYLEWYAQKDNWSSLSNIGDNELLCAQAFYKIRESGVVTSLSDGDTVVIFNPANKKALSSEYSGHYNKGTDVTLADGKLTGYTKADIWTVGVNADGTYTFSTAEGKKLSMGASYTSTPLDDVNPNWKITPVSGKDGYFYVDNTGRTDKYRLQWYVKNNNWSAFTGTGDNFEIQFYLVVDDGADTPDPGNLPAEGAQVVLYNQNAQGVLAQQNDNTDSPAITNVSAEVKDGKAIPANGGVVFTVQKSGDYYRFYNEAYGYLCSNGTGNNAFYTKDASNDADWLVRECSGGVGGFELESRTAKYSGHSQWLEYYADSYKSYSMYKVTDYTIYSFFFYPVADGVNVTDGIVNAPAVDFGTVQPAYVGQAYELTFTVDAPFGVDGDMTAKLGETALTVTVNESGVYTAIIPVEQVKGDKLTVTVSGKDTKGMPISGSAEITVKDEPSIIDLTPANGKETGEDKRPTISATIVNAGEEPTIQMTLNGAAVNGEYKDGKYTYTPAEDMADNSRVDVELTVTRKDEKTATVNWYFTVGKAQYQRYFGQLHGHTQYSDGSGSLESALDYISKLPVDANVHFVAFTDHSNYFDSKSNPNPEAALYDTSLVKDSDASHSWSTYKDTIAKFNSSHTGIIAIGGFEMTWSGGPGHINTFNTPGVVSRNNTTLNNKTDDAGLKAYYNLLSQSEGADSISQFNHPGTTFGNFVDFSYWDAVIDSRMYMVEVGNGEGQIGAGGYYPSYEQYIMALDKGWHVAPTNNQDNHKGRWGNANDARDVIITDNFSEEGIYEAIRAMRMYATEDKNLEVGYTVNGLMMGSSITEVPEKLDINVTVNDPDKSDSISKVEIVANSGKVVHAWSTAAELASGNLSVELAPEYSYYFVRVTEGDGDLAVTAPVWVGESLKLGISNVVCGTATPVTDEPLTLTTTLFNSESKDATVKSLTYSIKGGDVISTDTTERTLGASSTLAVDFQYTPTSARIMTITVTAVVEQDGKEFIFTKDITLDVLAADSLVYIGIDASHYNEYVAGNYKDSMGNFGNLAAEYSVRTMMLKTSDELIAACSNAKYKALILTAPSRRLEAAQADPRTYSTEELAAINAFNAAGGTVILAGWSDNYENYDVIQSNSSIKHMAATQNEVLAALGSSLRISDDATYDDVRSAADGVDKWRLYFSDYNMENFLAAGVEVDSDHPYDKLYTERFSHYGGASVYAVDASGNPTSTLPTTVSPVVYGHATTYSVDVDKDGLGGGGTPKYAYENDSRLMVMATEQIEGRGLIVVSGAAFMSNFEVQATISDNGSEKNYSNYKICENLLGKLNPVKISTVAAVQAEPDEGVKFTIEAVVTSNASGHDKTTAFFDCIYAQDATAGINCFPVAGDFKIGDKVRITGTTSSYQGERQLAVTSIVKIGEAEAPAPKGVAAAQVNDGSVLGSLIKVKGTVTRIEESEGLVQTIMVKDEAGNECRVFIDGYITTDKTIENLAVGCKIEAIGLASYDNTFNAPDGPFPRIRIRDRADITCTKSETGGDHTHDWGNWVVTLEPTCTKPGSKTRTCKSCDSTETVSIPATGHNYVNGKCTNCGKVKPSHTQPSVTPATPVESGTTGDTSNMGLWIVLLSASLFGSVTLVRSRKRRT